MMHGMKEFWNKKYNFSNEIVLFIGVELQKYPEEAHNALLDHLVQEIKETRHMIGQSKIFNLVEYCYEKWMEETKMHSSMHSSMSVITQNLYFRKMVEFGEEAIEHVLKIMENEQESGNLTHIYMVLPEITDSTVSIPETMQGKAEEIHTFFYNFYSELTKFNNLI